MSAISAENSQKIKNMSIICAMLVVTIHVDWPKDNICLTWFINELIENGIARVAVPFFFVVSGFFLSSHFDDERWWQNETKKRIQSLVIPFFTWGLISFFAFAPLNIIADVIAHRPFGTNLQLSDGRWMHAIGLDVNNTPGLTPLWYVRCLFFFVLLSPLFKFCVDKFKLWWIIFTFIVATAFSYIPVDTENSPFWIGFLCYGLSLSGIFYFSVGIYIKRCNVTFSSTPLAYASAIYGIGCVVAKTFAHAHGTTLPIGVGILTLPALMYTMWHITPTKELPVWFTSCSFSIFLLHCIFLGYAGAVLKHCPSGVQTSKLIACFVAITAPIILTNFLRKSFPRIALFLFAGRS